MTRSRGEPPYPEGFDAVLDRVVHPIDVPPRDLPRLRLPSEGPPVLTPLDEDLVPVSGRRLDAVAVYADADLPGSIEQTLVRRTLLDRLTKAAEDLPAAFGLVVLDAWRSHELQQGLWQAAAAAGLQDYVSEPVLDVLRPAPHTTGGTIDVTLSYRGSPLALGTAFDEFTPLAHIDALEGTDHPARGLRRLLYATLDQQGFVVHPKEWWHYELGTWAWAAARHREPWYGPIEPD